MATRQIHLPCLRGNFGAWNYFSTIMKVKDIVENKRIITVPESEVLYTNNINQILQREIDASRIGKIKEYLINSKERFFSSIIVAIHKGDPQWADFDLERQFRVDNDIVDEEDVDFIENKLGVLTLSGSEEIFVLDGQHRLLGIRKAFEEQSKIGDDEISIVFIVHKEELIERTRRLFTVLNRYAVTIKPAEKVILEEDDAAAILTRRLVQSYPKFLLDKAVSPSKIFSLGSTDTKHFTTLVCLYEISKVLINYNELYKSKVIIRPTNASLNKYYKLITNFWDLFFSKFPEVVKFVEGQEVSATFLRNKQTGGSLLLRPEGQLLIASAYKEFSSANDNDIFKNNIARINYDLSSFNWKYVFWTGEKMDHKNKKLKRSILRMLLGKESEKSYVTHEMKKIYKEHNLTYNEEIKSVVITS
ncbi:DNA sulfur modification protein DndB [Mucilaginibacter sp. KACC 22063]|uniref:DNA sulfur modification protein DndB n=1 Tax=Mucilaginibacter sp. KACC 22063 TaxID=3025666 RepID=UPI002365B0FC|nr:DNA sulfur modification protein DndB [Mucilaginibacter sp. KACC 22063]WDF54884.1 DNA sulfur modification protein DndB [Mucilaginibacter sp. KACC 22063]